MGCDSFWHTFLLVKYRFKKIISYLCQCTLHYIKIFQTYLSQINLFPWNNQNTINHNILLLTQYYIHKQHMYFTNILQTNFTKNKQKILNTFPHLKSPPYATSTLMTVTWENNIAYETNTIQIQQHVAHIYKWLVNNWSPPLIPYNL